MAAPLRFKYLGTGSEKAKALQITEHGAVMSAIVQVPCHATFEISATPTPYEVAKAGLAVFRWGIGVTDGYELNHLEIMLPHSSDWLNFVEWCYETFAQVPAYLESQVSIDSGNWGSEPLPMNDFLFCTPWLAANCLLFSKVAPFPVIIKSGAALLHVYRLWRLVCYREPFTISAQFDSSSLEFKFAGYNRLSVFLERPSKIGTQWSGYYPDAADSTITAAQPIEDAPGDMWANGHPWPEYNEENFVSGIVPIYAHAQGEATLGQPVIPLTVNTTSQEMTYLTSPITWQQNGGDGQRVFDAKLGGDYYAEPYAVWRNINPAESAEIAAERTSITPLPMPTGVGFIYDLMGRYRDALGRVQILAMGINYPVGALTEDETTEAVEGMDCAVVKEMTILESFIDSQSNPGSATWYSVDAWSPAFAIAARHQYEYERKLKLYRSYVEEVTIPEGKGPELVVSISTGLGVPAAGREEAVVCFYAIGSFTIEPIGDAPEPTAIEYGDLYDAHIHIPIRDQLEVDSEGNYLPFQKITLSYRITYLSGKLYPTTVGIGQASGSRPDSGAIYEGYELQ